jgi:hypothetical protein
LLLVDDFAARLVQGPKSKQRSPKKVSISEMIMTWRAFFTVLDLQYPQ